MARSKIPRSLDTKRNWRSWRKSYSIDQLEEILRTRADWSQAEVDGLEHDKAQLAKAVVEAAKSASKTAMKRSGEHARRAGLHKDSGGDQDDAGDDYDGDYEDAEEDVDASSPDEPSIVVASRKRTLRSRKKDDFEGDESSDDERRNPVKKSKTAKGKDTHKTSRYTDPHMNFMYMKLKTLKHVARRQLQEKSSLEPESVWRAQYRTNEDSSDSDFSDVGQCTELVLDREIEFLIPDMLHWRQVIREMAADDEEQVNNPVHVAYEAGLETIGVAVMKAFMRCNADVSVSVVKNMVKERFDLYGW